MQLIESKHTPKRDRMIGINVTDDEKLRIEVYARAVERCSVANMCRNVLEDYMNGNLIRIPSPDSPDNRSIFHEIS